MNRTLPDSMSRTRRGRWVLAMAGAAAALLLTTGAGTARGAFFTNGGFETGDFTGWTRSAFTGQGLIPRTDTNHNYQNFLVAQGKGTPATDTNAVVTQQTSSVDGFGPTAPTPAINPTEGTHLAFLSNETSAGNNTLTGSSISQTFTAPTGATFLSFDVRFLSNEVIDSQWDFGGVALLQGSKILGQFNLDHDPGTGTSIADVHATANAAGGFNDSTAWLTRSFSLAGLDGQNLTLVAYVINTLDMSVESRLLLDNVQVNGTAVVPEPASIVLVGLGAVGLLGHRSRRRRSSAR